MATWNAGAERPAKRARGRSAGGSAAPTDGRAGGSAAPPSRRAAGPAPPARLRGSGRPHLLGIDDGPFDIRAGGDATIVGVVTEGHELVESVAITRFAVDGTDVTAFLAAWIAGLRVRPALQGIVLGGITVAGLAVVDIAELARTLALPVLAVGRRDPHDHRLAKALAAAGLSERLAIVRRTPPALPVPGGAFVACAGTTAAHATALVAAARRKSDLPEALRVAHLIAAALARGESRGRP